MEDAAADIIFLGKNTLTFDSPSSLKIIYDYDFWLELNQKTESFPLLTKEQYLNEKELSSKLNFLLIDLNSLTEDLIKKLKSDGNIVLVAETKNKHGMAEQRRLFFELIHKDIANPVIVKNEYENISSDQFST